MIARLFSVATRLNSFIRTAIYLSVAQMKLSRRISSFGDEFTLERLKQFFRSRSALGLLIYLLLCVGLSSVSGAGFYYSNLNSFKQHKSEEKVTALQLVDAFVTTYSAITTKNGAIVSAVPAEFRAHAIARFNQEKGKDSNFTLRWVGREGREIATPPGDSKTAATIEAFAGSPNPTPDAGFVELDNQLMFRTVYPSLAREQSCIECHNALQPRGVAWQLNDVMGAFVIDVPTGSFVKEIRWSAFAFSSVFFVALAGIGGAFSVLHFRQLQSREAAQNELTLKVEERTLELQNARSELIAKHQKDIDYLEWLRRLATFLRHEVRQPVAQITSSIELIQLIHRDDEAIKPYVVSASRGAQHVWNLIERASRSTDAVAFVRESQLNMVDLSVLLVDLIADYSQTFSGIEFHLAEPGSVQIAANAMLLEKAVGNLLTNAASFANEGSTVLVTLKCEEAQAIIEVVNKGPLLTGEGEELFGPFASTRSTPSSEHHGLGLYLVRLVVDHYGGTAKISDLNDRSGVIASIYLPGASCINPSRQSIDSHEHVRT